MTGDAEQQSSRSLKPGLEPVEALLDRLSDRGVRLWVEEERLRCRAPAGALDGALAERRLRPVALSAG